ARRSARDRRPARQPGRAQGVGRSHPDRRGLVRGGHADRPLRRGRHRGPVV
ncbi:MAG: hypothetical protein AVDCRST_MAG85-1595, partial [uncultured Solirubrobacteraceae bacterium]